MVLISEGCLYACLINITTIALLGAGMLLISEWWASETAVMMGGLLPDPERKLSAMNIYQLTNAMCFMLPLGLAVAVGTRYTPQRLVWNYPEANAKFLCLQKVAELVSKHLSSCSISDFTASDSTAPVCADLY